MSQPAKFRLNLSALIAAAGIGLGAFGAHGLKSQLAANDSVSAWETAVLYHLVHAVALFALALHADKLAGKWAYRLWAVGILLFSGSLYALALTKWSLLGPITPLGGVAFIAGWITLIFESRK
ncbi:DUF423 domain-containing protein [Pelagicoccus sp. NFK12]|uniref:DUF423 domain-containing protein n=1 Tax=Pelagicoccus enzymogenes TaxID=2773457 RepID=A0A927FAQ9_9BACT|nr:DUF423 domain-containing protein [Pelagicoccus enzymogenes]MBD5780940.1 DUF423 domain-containing protein [Pelagicoccus enzymogenes]MDQ8199978.1 DUF423 domain-containing protein [Pelagicoccus enzymogenes]